MSVEFGRAPDKQLALDPEFCRCYKRQLFFKRSYLAMSVLKNESGESWYAEAVDFRSADPHATVRLGVSKSTIQNRAARGQTWALGQLYGVIGDGLIMTKHIFQGVRRPMSVNGNSHADEEKFVFTWAAQRDAQISRDGVIRYVAAPVATVFFVIASPNQMVGTFPEIFAWIENWGWLKADLALSGAPIDHESRYDTRVWSRQ